MNRAELKAAAKSQIKGKVGVLFLITLIIGVISGVLSLVLSFVPVAGPIIATVVVTPAFALSMMRVYLAVAEGATPKAKDAFCGFDDFWSAFKVVFLVGLFTFLWSLLLVIPGIIKAFSYSMSMYILAENKGKPALECIKESKEMTDGHKLQLFVLGLSFIGWAFVGVLTFGLGYIWIAPYMQATYTNAYNSLKPPVTFIDDFEGEREFSAGEIAEASADIDETAELYAEKATFAQNDELDPDVEEITEVAAELFSEEENEGD